MTTQTISRAGKTAASLLLCLCAAGCLAVPRDDLDDPRQDAGIPPRASDPSSWRNPHEPEISPAMQPLLRGTLSAEDAVRVALYNNRTIQSECDRLDRAAARARSARLLKNPELAASVIVSEEDADEEVIELGVELDVLHMLLLPRRGRIGRAQYNAARLELLQTVQSVGYDARTAYYRLLAARQHLRLQRQTLAAAEAGHGMAGRLREAGNIRKLDVLNRQALAEAAALEVSAAELAVTEAREDLNTLLGVWGGATGWTVTNELPQPPDPIPAPGAAITNALQNSVQLAMMRERIRAAAQRLGIARVESALPTLHLGVEAEREPNGVWLLGPMIALELPVFDFGQAQRPLARAELRSLWNEYAALVVTIRSALRRAAERVAISARRAERYRTSMIPLREDILERTQRQYNAMQVGVFELLQAKQAELAARSATIDELLNYWIARIELDQLRSGLLVESSSRVPRAGVGPSAAAAPAGGH